MKKGIIFICLIAVFVLGVIGGMLIITKNLNRGASQIPLLLRGKWVIVPYRSIERKEDETRLEIVGDISKCAHYKEYNNSGGFISSGYIVEGILTGPAVVKGQQGGYVNGIFHPYATSDIVTNFSQKYDDYNVYDFGVEFKGFSKEKKLLFKKKYKLGHLLYSAEYDNNGQLLSEAKFQFEGKL